MAVATGGEADWQWAAVSIELVGTGTGVDNVERDREEDEDGAVPSDHFGLLCTLRRRSPRRSRPAMEEATGIDSVRALCRATLPLDRPLNELRVSEQEDARILEPTDRLDAAQPHCEQRDDAGELLSDDHRLALIASNKRSIEWEEDERARVLVSSIATATDERKRQRVLATSTIAEAAAAAAAAGGAGTGAGARAGTATAATP